MKGVVHVYLSVSSRKTMAKLLLPVLGRFMKERDAFFTKTSEKGR